MTLEKEILRQTQDAEVLLPVLRPDLGRSPSAIASLARIPSRRTTAALTRLTKDSRAHWRPNWTGRYSYRRFWFKGAKP